MSLSQYGTAYKPAISEAASTNGPTPPQCHSDDESSQLSHRSLRSDLLEERALTKALCMERKRTDRSGRRFILMLLDLGGWLTSKHNVQAFASFVATLSEGTRETDLKGWYKDGSVFGVIFTEIGNGDAKAIIKVLRDKVTDSLWKTLRVGDLNNIRLSFHIYPEDASQSEDNRPADLALYPDQTPEADPKRASRVIKRAIDILGSSCAIVVLSPILLGIALAVKLTSRGPVLFRQERVGQYGTQFTFFKFRSMYLANDETIHKTYVTRFISGKHESDAPAERDHVFKIKDDPRVTRIGKLLRRSSLDELPQLINVLRGEMSLVGPRPPLPYEVDCYELWHKRRLLTVKPGITGLWQVSGRSRVRFDDMVRLDLKYAETWSVWLDIKILLRTPAAVFSGQGAY